MMELMEVRNPGGGRRQPSWSEVSDAQRAEVDKGTTGDKCLLSIAACTLQDWLTLMSCRQGLGLRRINEMQIHSMWSGLKVKSMA